MAQITIQIGQLTVTKTATDDAKAAQALEQFYIERSLGDANATPRQKVEAIIQWFMLQIRDAANANYATQKQREAAIEARALYDFVPTP